MRSRKKGRGLRTAIVMLLILLIAVAAVIIWKQWEYSASESFYDGLRGAVYCKGALI